MRILFLSLISAIINIVSTLYKNIENSNLDDNVLKIVDNITKSPFDIDRKYRGLVLKNGLKVVLVSDSQTNFSAAALTVAIGTWHRRSRNDPVEYMGMAHFVEHMLFQGSKKYPQKSEFWNFVDNHSGDKNAYTSDDRTTFYFTIASDYFAQALEINPVNFMTRVNMSFRTQQIVRSSIDKSHRDLFRNIKWSNFFIDPLFAEESVVNEVDAIQSEFDIYSKLDAWRLDQVYRSLCDRVEGFNAFTVGSKETLLQSAERRNVTLSSQAKKFFTENYSSNIMALSIVAGGQNLDQMAEMAAKHFGKIANKNLTRKIWQSPYGRNFLGKQLNVAALTDQKMLHVNFPVGLDMVPFRHKLAQRYVGRFFLSSDPGTFTYKLKEENLASAVGWDCDSPGRGSILCQVSFSLTEKGLREGYTIVNRLFTYLNEIVNNHLDEEWIFEENKQLMSAKFISQFCCLEEFQEKQTME
uniref:Uncharacterized protein n=1 Tax=Romanomermis culicivorax TaxID=13658 RepID=A0A915KSI1_ROMCU